jgi:putative hydrolases of HD superfamily
LCLIHDLGEGRTSDLNYVHQKYGRLAESEAVNDLSVNLPFGKEIKNAFDEAKDKITLEAKLAKDADNLEWIASLLDESKKGNIKANAWAKIALKRLKTPAGKKLGKLLFNIEPDSWWFKKDDQWFVDRKIKHLKK